MIEQAVIIALFVQAVNACFWEGMIFGKIGSWLEVKYHTLWKPLVGCSICMTFWYGLGFVLIAGFHPLTIFLAMGINTVVTLWRKD